MLEDARVQAYESFAAPIVESSSANLLRRCLDLIEVRAPYFALENLIGEGGELSADVPVQEPMGRERGVIGAGEAGRHLAILGACAAALTNPENGRHYYLAHTAHFTRNESVGLDEEESASSHLRGRARGQMLNKRTAFAKVELRSSAGLSMAQLDVQYHVLSERTFDKLYAKHPRSADDAPFSGNPYATRVRIHEIHPEGELLTASVGMIQACQCAGHFDGHPAMPVAVSVQTLVDAACELMHVLHGRPEGERYLVTDARLRADHLAFAGERVDIRIAHLGCEVDGYHRFDCQAYAGTESVCSMLLTLKS